MRKLFSEQLLSEIHIKLDKQRLRGFSEKEIIVLHQKAIVGSTGQLNIKIEGVIREIGINIDHAIEPIHQELRNSHYWYGIAVAGIWAIAATLIANLIIELLIG